LFLKEYHTQIGLDMSNAALAFLLTKKLKTQYIGQLRGMSQSFDKVVHLLESVFYSIESALENMFSFLNSDINGLSGRTKNLFSTTNTNPSICEYPLGDGPYVRVAKKLLEKIKEKESKKDAFHWAAKLDKSDVNLLRSLLNANDIALTSLGSELS
jgi:hypothetical protein